MNGSIDLYGGRYHCVPAHEKSCGLHSDEYAKQYTNARHDDTKNYIYTHTHNEHLSGIIVRRKRLVSGRGKSKLKHVCDYTLIFLRRNAYYWPGDRSCGWGSDKCASEFEEKPRQAPC